MVGYKSYILALLFLVLPLVALAELLFFLYLSLPALGLLFATAALALVCVGIFKLVHWYNERNDKLQPHWLLALTAPLAGTGSLLVGASFLLPYAFGFSLSVAFGLGIALLAASGPGLIVLVLVPLAYLIRKKIAERSRPTEYDNARTDTPEEQDKTSRLLIAGFDKELIDLYFELSEVEAGSVDSTKVLVAREALKNWGNAPNEALSQLTWVKKARSVALHPDKTQSDPACNELLAKVNAAYDIIKAVIEKHIERNKENTAVDPTARPKDDKDDKDDSVSAYTRHPSTPLYKSKDDDTCPAKGVNARFDASDSTTLATTQGTENKQFK